MAEFAGQGRRRDGQDRALGVRHAVAAHLGEGQAGQRISAAGSHDQHIVRAAGQVHQHPPRRPRSTRGCTSGSPGTSPHTATSASRSCWQARSRHARPSSLAGWIRPRSPGTSKASTGIRTASCARARTSPKRSACRLPGEPLVPTMSLPMPNTVQPVFLIDWEWQVIRSHLLLGESGPAPAPSRRRRRTPRDTQSAFTGPEKVISRAVPATTSPTCGSGRFGADAIMGGRRASGEVTAGTP